MTLQRQFRPRLSRIFSFRGLGFVSVVTLAICIYVHVTSYTVHEDEKRAVINYEIRHSHHISITTTTAASNGSSYEVQTCIHPSLDINDPVMKKFYRKFPKVTCKGDKNWVYVYNGTLRFSDEAEMIHGPFHCDYYPLIRGPGDHKINFAKPVKNIKDSTPLVSDFFQIKCISRNHRSYENIHAGVHYNATIRERIRTSKPPANGLGLSIAFLGFDSMSRMSWLRRMPKTRDYMVNELKAIELEGYNIMGDGTPAALFPILTGKHEHELPEARKKFKNAKPVDDFPWLWKAFQKNGYVTSWADAEVGIAPFNYRLLGFEHPPTDYFMRPFYLAVNPNYKRYSPHCHGSEPKHIVWFKFIWDIFSMYKHDPKFLVHFYTPLSHDDNNKITMADDDLKEFISRLHNGGFLNNTVLAVMADHGARFNVVRKTVSGRLEERLPYVSLVFPPWFERKYPHLMRNVKTNVHRLTTPLDLHETFKDFLKFDGAGIGDTRNRGISLFKEIPESRSCVDANVEPHWCACLEWRNISVTDRNARRALQAAIDSINNYTEPYRSDCALLIVNNVTTLSRMTASEKVIKFRHHDEKGFIPSTEDKSLIMEKVMYQVTFTTEPGQGEFEITLQHLLDSDVMVVNPKSISRINHYGDAPACILNKNREIRQYCYCKTSLPQNV